jgi:CRISPR-associated protein Csb1
LASAWIKDAQKDNKLMLEVIRDALNLRDNIPLDYRQIAQGIFSLDPMSLIHGVFFADKKWPGQPKIRRALSATIEAANVERVIYGGVKRELVMHKLETDQGGTSEGYGSIPFHRQEFTAKDITLHVNLDVKQLFSYGLSESASKLLEAIAKFQVRTILDDGLRARTSCNLIAVEFSDFESIESLTDQIEQGINDCRDLFPVQGPIDVLHKVKKS